MLDFGGEPVKSLSSQSVLEPEPFAQMPVKLFLGDVFQQLVADPVGLHHPLVEGILNLIGMRDVKQVGVHCLESGEELCQSRVGDAFPNVSEDLGIGVGPAVMQAVGTKGIAAGAQKSIHHTDDTN